MSLCSAYRSSQCSVPDEQGRQLWTENCVEACLADALRCRLCSSLQPGMPCMPQKMTCNSHPPKEACLSVTISYGGQVEQKMLGCIQADNKKCGLTWDDPQTGRHAEYKCCSDRDHCNE
ncbi:unnamed protein product [Caretta caretta]